MATKPAQGRDVAQISPSLILVKDFIERASSKETLWLGKNECSVCREIIAHGSETGTRDFLKCLEKHYNASGVSPRASKMSILGDLDEIEALLLKNHCASHDKEAIMDVRLWAGKPESMDNLSQCNPTHPVGTDSNSTPKLRKPSTERILENSTTLGKTTIGGAGNDGEHGQDEQSTQPPPRTPIRSRTPIYDEISSSERGSSTGSKSYFSPDGSREFSPDSMPSLPSTPFTPPTPITPPSSEHGDDDVFSPVAQSPSARAGRSMLSNMESPCEKKGKGKAKIATEEGSPAAKEKHIVHDMENDELQAPLRLPETKSTATVLGKISYDFRPFSLARKTPVTKFHIWSVIENPFTSTDKKEGILYILKVKNKDGKEYFKVGRTENRVYERYRSSCCVGVLMAESEIHFVGAQRAEHLVHADLFQERRNLINCPSCGKRHKEWFETSFAHVKASVIRWTRFVSHPDAYVDGRLSDKARGLLYGIWHSEDIVNRLEMDHPNFSFKNLKSHGENGVVRERFKHVSAMRRLDSAAMAKAPSPSHVMEKYGLDSDDSGKASGKVDEPSQSSIGSGDVSPEIADSTVKVDIILDALTKAMSWTSDIALEATRGRPGILGLPMSSSISINHGNITRGDDRWVGELGEGTESEGLDYTQESAYSIFGALVNRQPVRTGQTEPTQVGAKPWRQSHYGAPDKNYHRKLLVGMGLRAIQVVVLIMVYVAALSIE